MRNATISTSRTRATTERLIDYRPLPAAYGDRESLQAVRAAKARAAARGEDPSTLQLPVVAEEPLDARAPQAGRQPLLSFLRRTPGIHRRGPHRPGHLATA